MPGTPPVVLYPSGINEAIAWLDQQIISVVYAGPRPAQTLTVFDRSDCHGLFALPVAV
jgi:hypothetical protein